MKNKTFDNITFNSTLTGYDDTMISPETFYLQRYNVYPNTLSKGRDNFDPSIIDTLLKYGFKKLFSRSTIVDSRRNIESHSCNYEYLYEFEEIAAMALVTKYSHRDEICCGIKLLFQDEEPLQPLIKSLREQAKKFYDEEKTISLVTVDYNGSFDLHDFPSKITELDIELNYGAEFTKIHHHIENSLKTKKTGGLVLLHGDPGTGKSTYIKYLAYIVPKKFLFIPTSIATSIDTPNFISLLAENQNCILILEDAEKILVERADGSDSPVATILNMTDGIVGDCLGTLIIATFNTSNDTIDKALTRKGRLVAEHHFEALSIENTEKLVKQLNIELEVTRPMTLAEIYCAQNEYYKVADSAAPKIKIGF